jgi:hypothetical protein
MGFLLFALRFVAAVYALTGIGILIWHGLRSLGRAVSRWIGMVPGPETGKVLRSFTGRVWRLGADKPELM